MGSASCSKFNGSGRIVFMEYNLGCGIADKLVFAQQGGAIAAVMMVHFYAGHLSTVPIYLNQLITIPCYEIRETDVMFTNSNSTIFANITDSENGWLILFNSAGFITLQTIVCVYYSGVLVYLVYTVYYHAKIRGFGFSITWMTFILEFFGLIVILVASLDLAYSRRIFGQDGYVFVIFLYVQCAVLTNLLMAFYFLELFGNKLNSKSMFLKQYRTLFISILLVGFIIRIIFLSLQQSYKILPLVDTMAGGMILLIQTGISLILLLAVVIRSNRKLKEYGNVKNFKLLVVTVNRFVILCMIGSLGFLIIVATLVTNGESTYWGNIIVCVSPILYGMVSLVKIHRLAPHNQVKIKTSTSDKKSNPNTNSNTNSITNSNNNATATTMALSDTTTIPDTDTVTGDSNLKATQ